jgi:hypothetical protein
MTDRGARDPYADTRRPPYADPDVDAGYEPVGRGPGRRISPVAVFLAIAIIGSVAYMAYVLTVREATQIPLLASGAVILAIVFAALAAFCVRSIWRAGTEPGHAGRMMLTALVGGGAAIAAAGFAAAALILFQLAAGSG